jgi:hypothetical protein
MSEVWRNIEGYENLYEVSSVGRVKSLPRKTTKGRIIKNGNRCNGYQAVTLSRDNKPKSHYVHRLVATAFLGNTDNKPCVNHIDGNPSNNSVTNLEWATYTENEQHSYTVLGKITHNKNTSVYETHACPHCRKSVTAPIREKRKFCSKSCSSIVRMKLTQLKGDI